MITAKQREEEFRGDLLLLLEAHGAQIELGYDEDPLLVDPVVMVTMYARYSDKECTNLIHDSAEFEL